ncbi:hypothetical protein [Cellulomonas carbonis]|uniref:MtN3 and saliva related transmembrane protein n=1 Tax=Cellulomonas carbonis T26 TaxID=947969 RepID=A0A0A0BU89_9CELL|nr:hypothetical protein [Cellulomonas carbonis]KGM10694.1 hypothetical protein N868_14130 [Cellulomonas carbonis T26]GGC07592.1 hypothetical protein GCM10010972_21100 [Cellulomonas carbonis]
MQLLTEAVGLVASLFSLVVWMPQAARVWRVRHDPVQLSGVSLLTQAMSVGGAVAWTAYAVLIDSFWVGAPSVVNGPLAIATIVVVRRSRRAGERFAVPVHDVDPAPLPGPDAVTLAA